ncbi:MULTISPECIES: hypothetical protein [Marinomonas]|uniref:Uncharacterized protein n=1 Tax=Marinomonas arctica TaxID=383750 RepID=A0A7H1JAP7_9GAMM|nr:MULTISPECIES: hypothetical protein [Marinomonas]QNT07563.1 hypothetical protein IBG28_08130 [Marinomonas arctica]GGN20858.1 hypothetical protein GCM10011350_07880 [Marinomonas arctica]
MTAFDTKVEELIAKHPNLTKDEAIKIVTEKNNRKKQKRNERSNKGSVNKG